MKLFEDWWDEIHKGKHASLPQHKFQAEVVWRAALNKILNMVKSEADELFEVEEMIERELRNEEI